MNLIELPHCRICWVEVPEGAMQIHVIGGENRTHTTLRWIEPYYRTDIKGNWQLLGRASEIH